MIECEMQDNYSLWQISQYEVSSTEGHGECAENHRELCGSLSFLCGPLGYQTLPFFGDTPDYAIH